MNTYVLYHAGCLDGFGSAAVAYLKLGEGATYIPCKYNEPIPELDPGSIVYIVDFSFSREVHEKLLRDHEEVVVLDHHKSAQETLLGIRGALFDMNKSGAMLTWEYFFLDRKPPYLIELIQDRDLWRWELPETKAVVDTLYALGMEHPKDWLHYMNWKGLDKLMEIAEGVVLVNNNTVKHQADRHYFATLPGSPNVAYPTVNCSTLPSETLHSILTKYQSEGKTTEEVAVENMFDTQYITVNYQIAVGWYENSKEIKYSLRGDNGGCDVLANQYKGGGHPNASGFTHYAAPKRINLRRD